jgi:hypothetical protein
LALPKRIKSVLLGLKGSANGIGAGGSEAGTDRDLIRNAIAVPLVILAVLHVTADALVHVATAVVLVIHDMISFR